MAIDARLLLLAPVVLGAYTASTVAGFGAMVIALTVGAHLYPLGDLLPVLVPLSVLLSAVIVARDFQHVDRGLLARRVLPLLGVGVALGALFFGFAGGPAFKRAFGVLVVALAVLEVTRPRVARGGTAPLLVASGVTHALFASGGPLLVVALGRMNLSRQAFRATLTAVWLVLNLVLTAAYASEGRIGADELRAMATLAPCIPLGIALGERLQGRIDERVFRKGVAVLLGLAGAALVIG